MIYLKDYRQYTLCKDIYLRFTAQFALGKMNNYEFFIYHKNLFETNPELTNYIYQFALSSCYNTKRYDSREIEAVFNNHFKIKDMYGLNGSECDISTLNSAIVVSYMIKNTPFKSIPINIFNAPLEYNTELYKRVQESSLVRPLIEKSLYQTGQPNNDIQIGDRLYDIKHTNTGTTVLNHVLPWTYERIEAYGQQHLNNVYANLQKTKGVVARDLLSELYEIKKASDLTPLEKFYQWNACIKDNWISLEKHEILLPIVIPMTTKPFKPQISKNMHEKLHINNNVAESEEAARSAVIASISVRYRLKSAEIFAQAKEMTNGLLDSTQIENSLDMPD